MNLKRFIKSKNRLDYIDGADLIANEAIEQVVLAGQSRAYGLEIMAKRTKVNGTAGFLIHYHVLNNEQQGRTSNEIGINNGTWYKTGWDKTHNLAITTSYELTQKWSFGSILFYKQDSPLPFLKVNTNTKALLYPYMETEMEIIYQCIIDGIFRPL